MRQLFNHSKVKLYNLLRWSEKYTKTDMVYLAGGGFWLALGKGIALLGAFALSIAYANLLPADVFGNYRFVLALATIITAFSLTGIGTAIIRAVARGDEGVLRNGVWTHLKWSFGIIGIALAGSFYYFLNDNITLSLALLIVAFFSPLLESFKLYAPFLNGKKEFQRRTIYMTLKTVVSAGSLVGIMLLTQDPVLLVLAYFAIHTLIAIALYIRTLFLYDPERTQSIESISYGKHLSVMEVVGRIANNIDKILVFHFLGAAQVAVYTFALAIPQHLRSSNQILQALALPKMSERPLSELRRSLPRKIIMLFIPIGAVAALYIISAPAIFSFVFPYYLESVLFSQVFALILLFMPIALLQNALIAHMQKKQLYIIKIGVPVFKIVLLAALLPLYGIWGGVIALLSAQAAGAASILFFFYRIEKSDTRLKGVLRD